MIQVRKPAVSGTFYPADPDTLRREIEGYLNAAPPLDTPFPKALIVPHAGYIYSGPVAGCAYQSLRSHCDQITRVVLIGPAHRVALKGLALPAADAFETPLGTVPLDRQGAEKILALPQVSVFDAAHGPEHSLEVQIPFLQRVLGAFTLVPLVAGDATAGDVEEVIETLASGPDTLIVISSDLSHYLGYDAAAALDHQTAKAIEALNERAIAPEQACGRVPVSGLLRYAQKHGLEAHRLDLRNSGDTAGAKTEVVGYGAWLFSAPNEAQKKETNEDGFAARTHALLDAHGETLLKLAARSIRHGLDHGHPLDAETETYDGALGEMGATFVTLKHGDALRGCIGTPEAYRALARDVAENGFGAAFGDSRFPPLGADELSGLTLSVSVLSAATPLAFEDEDDLLSQMRPGTDGLIFEDGFRRGLFLPQVWEQVPEAALFLAHLKQKAGLPGGHWSDSVRVSRFIAPSVTSAILGPPGALWQM